MCRILIAHGRLSELEQHYPGLIRGIIGSSYYDPYQVRAFGPEDYSHSDGWGRAVLLVGAGKTSLQLYRSLSPIFVDKPPLRPLEAGLLKLSNPLVIDMIHARASSTGMPVNFLSVQPFEYQTASGSRLILIHNGSVDKEKLAEEIELASRKALPKYSDSYVMGLWLSERLEDRIEISIISKLRNYVKTALNIGLLLIAENRVELLAGSYYSKTLSLEKKDYYRMYSAELSPETFIVLSSTIACFDEYRPYTIRSWRELANGTYYHVEIELRRDNEPKTRVTKISI